MTEPPGTQAPSAGRVQRTAAKAERGGGRLTFFSVVLPRRYWQVSIGLAETRTRSDKGDEVMSINAMNAISYSKDILEKE